MRPAALRRTGRASALVTRTKTKRCASIDATVAAGLDPDNCDPGRSFGRRTELDEGSYPEYRDEYTACFARFARMRHSRYGS